MKFNRTEYMKKYRQRNKKTTYASLKSWHNGAGKIYYYFQQKATLVKRHKCGGDIVGSQLVEIYNQQKGRCALTGRELLIRNGVQHSNCASIDRINHKKGYTKSNIRLITYQANAARGMGSDLDLAKFCVDVLRTRARRA